MSVTRLESSALRRRWLPRHRAALLALLAAILCCISLGAWFVAWELAITINPSYAAVMSTPERTFHAAQLLAKTNVFWNDVYVTLREVLLGLAVGAVSGTLLAFVAATYRRLQTPILRTCVIINSVPKLALAPLLIVWFGIGTTPKILLMWLVTFVAFVLNIHAALEHLKREWVARLEVSRATRLQHYRFLFLPFIVPTGLQTLRFSIGTGLRAVIFAEYLGSSAGLGYLITYYGNALNASNLMVALIAIIIVGLGLELMVMALQARIRY